MTVVLQSLLGFFTFILIAWVFSENRRQVDWRLLVTAVLLQFGLGALFLKVPPVAESLVEFNVVVGALQSATQDGAAFVFGYLAGRPEDMPFEVTRQSATFIFAFQALPMVIVVAALAALLWHWRILPLVTRAISFVLARTLNLGGAVGLATAANLFLGMIESPLFIRAYIARLTRSELMTVMTVGLSTVAGSVVVLYSLLLEPKVPGALGHIVAASLISLPAAILISKIMVPGREVTQPDETDEVIAYGGSLDAVTRGTADGLNLYLTIVATLLVLTALVALANIVLTVFPDVLGDPLTVQRIFGWIFAPFVWLAGIPWTEVMAAGQLFGEKTILNELIAYISLSNLPEGTLSDRSELIMVYALCGFANLGSVGMLIGALTSLAPTRRQDILDLGPKALVGGSLATLMTGAVAGVLTL